MSSKNIDQLCVDTIRTLSMDAVQKANSGHPGMPMGTADMAYVLWTKFLKHNPANPNWADRDRFVLSAGHGSMLLYSLLHLTGYDVSLDDIKNFRQWGSKTPGHPEVGHTPGVETTTGPLGQGFATGVGMAMAEVSLTARFNNDKFPVTDHYTYAIVSDGDLMEGISHEAASLAGHLKLGKLIYLYDANSITIDGTTDVSFTEDVAKRFDAYGWHVLEVDGHDRDAIEKAIEASQNESDKPSLVICRTHIGFGSPNKQDSPASHGAPLGDDEIVATKKAYGWDPEKKFYIPEEVAAHMGAAKEAGAKAEAEWNELFDNYKKHYPQLAEAFNNAIERKLPADLEAKLPVFDADKTGLASRKASGEIVNALAKEIPFLVGGSADLSGSNLTTLKGEEDFMPANYGGRNVFYGVREHGMAAAMNGMALHGGVIPYGGTFLVFSDYNRPSIRVGALSKIPTIHVFTHDSIGLGEDGPTHQPIEHLASLRAMPNVTVLRPADANETAYAWLAALQNAEGPSLLVLTRQNLPTFERTEANAASNTLKGAYILAEASKETPDCILLASGSEVELILKAKETLEADGIATRVVSVPSFELFEKQDETYKEAVLPKAVTKRVAIEAASTFGWDRFVGSNGATIGLDHFGASAPAETLYEKFGITAEAVVAKAKSL